MTTPADAAAPAAKPAALWEDLVDVFTAPAAVFARRRDGRFWLALLVFSLLGAVSVAVARPVIRPAIERQLSAQVAQIRENPQIPAEDREALARRVQGAADSPFALAAAAAAFPLGAVVAALVLWLVAKAFGSEATYGQALTVASIGGIPRAVVGLLTAGGMAAVGHESETLFGATASPAAFLGAQASPVLAAFLSRLDLGVLWHTVLLGVGIAVMGRLARRGGVEEVRGTISRGRGLAAAAIVWGLATLMVVWQALSAPTG